MKVEIPAARLDANALEFRSLLEAGPLRQIGEAKIALLQRLYVEVLRESAIQNVTKQLDPLAFYEGHVLDAWELHVSGLYVSPGFDLGTGMGSPGLFHAIIADSQWVLCDSEAMKIGFVRRVVEILSVPGVQCVTTRGELELDRRQVGVVVSKAVGKVLKVYGWIQSCSTWNTLILFKGPGWEEEWAEFLTSKYKSRLKIEAIHEYAVSDGEKKRKIISLSRC